MLNEMDADDQRVRTVSKNDKTFVVTQKDPYGFCYVTIQGENKVPEDFDGAFTTFNEAFYAIDLYIEKNKDKEPSRKKLEAKLQ